MANITQLMPTGSVRLDAYLDSVYGRAPTVAAAKIRAAEFRWDAVEFIWKDALPAALATCRWPCDPDVREPSGSVFEIQANDQAPGTLFVYRREALLVVRALKSPDEIILENKTSAFDCPHRDPRNGHGTQVNLSASAWRPSSGYLAKHYTSSTPYDIYHDAGWYEVAHRVKPQELSLPYAGYAGYLWMYAATGSGVWYRMGRTLVHQENHIFHYSRSELEMLGVDTVVKVRSAEAVSPGYKVEIIWVQAAQVIKVVRNCSYNDGPGLLRCAGDRFSGGWRGQAPCILPNTPLRSRHTLRCGGSNSSLPFRRAQSVQGLDRAMPRVSVGPRSASAANWSRSANGSFAHPFFLWYLQTRDAAFNASLPHLGRRNEALAKKFNKDMAHHFERKRPAILGLRATARSRGGL